MNGRDGRTGYWQWIAVGLAAGAALIAPLGASAQSPTTKPLAGPAVPTTKAATVTVTVAPVNPRTAPTTKPATRRPTVTARAKTTTTKARVTKKSRVTTKPRVTVVRTTAATVPIGETTETITETTIEAVGAGPIAAPPPGISYAIPVAFTPGAGRVLEIGAADVRTLAAGGRADPDVRGAAGLAASGTGSVVLDVTVITPTALGKVTLSPLVPDDALPLARSVITFGAGPTHSARVAVPIGSEGKIHLETTLGPSGITIDVVGWITRPPAAGTNEPSSVVLTPCRILDTASDRGGLPGLVSPEKPFDLPGRGVAAVPPTGAPGTQPVTVIMSTTANGATGSLRVNVQPTGLPTPQLQLAVGPGRPSNALFTLSADARIAFYVSEASTNLAIDVVGWLDKDGGIHTGGPCTA